MSAPSKIEGFVNAVRGRLNRFRLADSFFHALLAGAGVLLLISLVFVLRGYAVPRGWYLALPVAILLGTGITWMIRRRNAEQAARFADGFFGLKDAISSYWHFRNQRREGAVYALQGEATAARVDQLDPESVTYHWPRRLLVTTTALVALCTVLAFKKASPQVVEKMRVAEETAAKTEEINEHLEEVIDELEKATEDDEELSELDPDQLREWVAELKNTENREDAMRQYAELERKLQEAARRLDQRKNEQILAKAAEELQKAEEQEPRALGKKLAEKKYREAGEDLENLSPEEMKPEKLSEQRKELAKLKSAAQRMAAAAKAANRSGSSSSSAAPSESGSSSESQGSKSSSGGGGESGGQGGAGSSGEGMEDQLAQLDSAVKGLDNALKNAEREMSQTGQCSAKTGGQCESQRQAVLTQLRKLNQSLCKVGSSSKCQSRLLSMCQKLGQCQGYLCQSQFSSLGQCMGSKPGGKKAGNGSVESRRDPLADTPSSGQLTQLQGTKGQGPSVSTVEAADDGDGVATRRGSAKQREFQHQLESFVQREDVPADVKEGVKEYFKQIHQSESAEQ